MKTKITLAMLLTLTSCGIEEGKSIFTQRRAARYKQEQKQSIWERVPKFRGGPSVYRTRTSTGWLVIAIKSDSTIRGRLSMCFVPGLAWTLPKEVK